MAEKSRPKCSEFVYRGLVRLPAELDTREPKDDQDFVRRKRYRKTGKPENGLSVFRKKKFRTLQEFWDRLHISNPIGAHISIRCPECDMEKLPTICKPKGAKDHWACPFFDIDRFELEQAFDLIEPPAVRALTAKNE